LTELSAVYRVLALSLLLLGGAGLAAQMLVSLSLRVREIGIRRATGASKGAIFRQFLAEALELGLAAGTVGVLLGVALSLVAARVQEVSFVLDWSWTALALAVALLVAALFSAGPARAASSIPPARAMRENA
jgi:putative ABC transport system permease protein